MCGIFGIAFNQKAQIDERLSARILMRLFLLSESRGKEASGFAIHNGREIIVQKTPFPASKLVKNINFKKNITAPLLEDFETIAAIGHSRLVTAGYEQYNQNNQPVVKKNIVTIHNGIIVNQKRLWKKYEDEERSSDLDSELLPTLTRRFYLQDKSLFSAIRRLFAEISGTASMAMLFADLQNMLLATNNGSLYYVAGFDGQSLLFASERFILQKLISKKKLTRRFPASGITQLRPLTACLINLKDMSQQLLEFANSDKPEQFDNIQTSAKTVLIKELVSLEKTNRIQANTSLEHSQVQVPKEFEIHFQRCQQAISILKRCTKCLLPETFPFIGYDENGVCNYCRNYRPHEMKGEDSFKKLCATFHSAAGKPDCLVPFSGGRDSSFVLHYLKKELAMNPLAFSYDWGMLTDLGRRNQARLCGKLGVEHVLVSADIRKKRVNIRKNVLAWLKRPNLGTVPLFMAGDKQYFHFANLLMRQNNIKLSLLGENLFEKTNFKSGFCGIKPGFDKTSIYALSNKSKFKLAAFYGKEFLLNPAYLNSSIMDSCTAFKSYYMIKHQNVNVYNYIRWDEEKIMKILTNEYEWEIDPGTKTTWRIGDGTAAFYNYIYYTVAGFTENDTFRSNQIREGQLSRAEALELANEENRPRFDSLKWYCDTIQIDFLNTIRSVNNIRNLYER